MLMPLCGHYNTINERECYCTSVCAGRVKYGYIGKYVLNGDHPKRSGQINCPVITSCAVGDTHVVCKILFTRHVCGTYITVVKC